MSCEPEEDMEFREVSQEIRTLTTEKRRKKRVKTEGLGEESGKDGDIWGSGEKGCQMLRSLPMRGAWIETDDRRLHAEE